MTDSTLTAETPSGDISDEELAALAMSADPDAAAADIAGDDIPSLWELDTADRGGVDLLPAWYMPAPMVGAAQGRRWWRWAAIAIISAFVAINAAGLCSTYGRITLG